MVTESKGGCGLAVCSIIHVKPTVWWRKRVYPLTSLKTWDAFIQSHSLITASSKDVVLSSIWWLVHLLFIAQWTDFIVTLEATLSTYFLHLIHVSLKAQGLCYLGSTPDEKHIFDLDNRPTCAKIESMSWLRVSVFSSGSLHTLKRTCGHRVASSIPLV